MGGTQSHFCFGIQPGITYPGSSFNRIRKTMRGETVFQSVPIRTPVRANLWFLAAVLMVLGLLGCVDQNAESGAASSRPSLTVADDSTSSDRTTSTADTGAAESVAVDDSTATERLWTSVREGQPNRVRELIRRGADTNASREDDWSILHEAAKLGNHSVVRELLKAGASMVFTNDGVHPLHVASEYGHSEVVKVFLSAGVDVDVQDTVSSGDGRYGEKPLHLAISHGRIEAAQTLLLAGASPDSKNGYHETPLHLATARGDTVGVRLLVEWGANVEAESMHIVDHGIPTGNTPLHRAAEDGYVHVVRLLVDAGADIDAKNYYAHMSPMHFAARRGEVGAVLMLIDAGADVNARTAHIRFHSQGGQRVQTDDTPLHYAAHAGHAEACKALINAGARIDAENIAGQTPLDVATSRAVAAIAELVTR